MLPWYGFKRASGMCECVFRLILRVGKDLQGVPRVGGSLSSGQCSCSILSRVGRVHSWTPLLPGTLRTSGVLHWGHLAHSVVLHPPRKRPNSGESSSDTDPQRFCSSGIPRLLQGEGLRGGLSIGMSVAVLACWRPISQTIFATIKECGRVKWRFHIQQGKMGVHLGTVAGGGEEQRPLLSFPFAYPLV